MRNNSWTSKNSEPSIRLPIIVKFDQIQHPRSCVLYSIKSGVVCITLFKPDGPLVLHLQYWLDSSRASCLVKSPPLLSPSHLQLQCVPLALTSGPVHHPRPGSWLSNKGPIWRKWFQNLSCMSFVTVFRFLRQVMKRSLNVTYGDIPTNQTLINAQYWDNKNAVFNLFITYVYNVFSQFYNTKPTAHIGLIAEALAIFFWQMVISNW